MELPTLTIPSLKETICVSCCFRRSSKRSHDGRPKGKINTNPVRHPDALRSREKLRPIGKLSTMSVAPISEASGKLAKYAVELGAYNITYMPRNAVKGQVLMAFLNEAPVRTGQLEICSLADDKKLEEWTLFTDDASSLKGAGVGLVLIDPTGTEYTYAIRLNFASTNNEAEYKALLARLRIAGKMKVPTLKVKKADILSKLASVAFNHLTKEILVEVLNAKSVEAREINAIIEEEEDNWMTPNIKCIEEGIWLKDENEVRALWMKIGQYVMEEGILFKKSYLSPMLRSVGPLQANYIIREVHEGACGMHARARSVMAKIIRQGYYWPSMHRDTKEVVDRCDSCQIHGPVPKLPKTKLTSIMSP
ncbi:reverse transcriptase domain-containing protein [Tanacetum coccineum]